MTAATATERRVLPRGWGDLFLQLGIWFGFLAAYQVVRGIADRPVVITVGRASRHVPVGIERGAALPVTQSERLVKGGRVGRCRSPLHCIAVLATSCHTDNRRKNAAGKDRRFRRPHAASLAKCGPFANLPTPLLRRCLMLPQQLVGRFAHA